MDYSPDPRLKYGTKLDLANNYAINVTDARNRARVAADAVYEQWLASDMSIVERDRRTAGIDARLTAEIQAERDAWYYGLAQLAA